MARNPYVIADRTPGSARNRDGSSDIRMAAAIRAGRANQLATGASCRPLRTDAPRVPAPSRTARRPVSLAADHTCLMLFPNKESCP